MTNPYEIIDTGDRVSVTVGSATFIGAVDNVTPPPIWSGDQSALADEYNSNAPGKATGRVRVFRDVPFTATPPARFTHPVHGIPSGTIDCTRFRFAPWQKSSLELVGNNTNGRWPTGAENGVFAWHRWGIVESGDIARCTIYMPDTDVDTGRTIIFFPGGGGDEGSMSAPWYFAHRLAAEGFRVVQGNYPRGFLGHFYHPSLGVGPNFALSYAKSLIRWTHEYIGAWGGLADGMTLSGGSFGGALVMAAIEDEEIRSLIDRVMIISGGGLGERNRKIISRRGGLRSYEGICDGKTFALNRVFPRGEQPIPSWLRNTLTPQAFLEVHDGTNIFLWEDEDQVIHANAVEAARAGVFDDMDILFVVAANEASVNGINRSSDTLVLNREIIANGFGFPGGSRQMEASGIIDSGLNQTEENILLLGLYVYWWPAQMMARIADARGSNVYAIYDNYKSPGNGTDFTSHTSFSAYAFGGYALGWKTGLDAPQGNTRQYAQDVQHSEAVMTGIKNFLNSGDMNGSDQLSLYSFSERPSYSWSPFTNSNKEWNILGADSLFAAGGTASNTVVNDWRKNVFDILGALPLGARLLASE